MPPPFLSTLPASARAAYPFIVSGVRQGLSSRAIERIIRAADLPISRARSIVPLMRELRVLDAAGANVRFIPKALTINVARLPESITHIRREFSFQVRIAGRDVFDQLIERNVTVTTDRRLVTPAEIEDTARGFLEDEDRYEQLGQLEVTLQSGMRRAEFPL